MCLRWSEHSLVSYILERRKTSVNICKINIGSVWKRQDNLKWGGDLQVIGTSESNGCNLLSFRLASPKEESGMRLSQ